MQIFVDGNKYVMKHREWCWITRNFLTYMMRTSAALAGTKEQEVIVKVVFKPTGENVTKSLVLDKDYVKSTIGARAGWQVVDTDPFAYSYMWWAYKFFHEKYLAHREVTAAADHERVAQDTAINWWKEQDKKLVGKVRDASDWLVTCEGVIGRARLAIDVARKDAMNHKNDKATIIKDKIAEIKKANGWE